MSFLPGSHNTLYLRILHHSALWLSGWSTPTGIAAQIMGHKPSATAEKHYRVCPLDLLRKWHTRIEAWILEQAGIELPMQTGFQKEKSVAV